MRRTLRERERDNSVTIGWYRVETRACIFKWTCMYYLYSMYLNILYMRSNANDLNRTQLTGASGFIYCLSVVCVVCARFPPINQCGERWSSRHRRRLLSRVVLYKRRRRRPNRVPRIQRPNIYSMMWMREINVCLCVRSLQQCRSECTEYCLALPRTIYWVHFQFALDSADVLPADFVCPSACLCFFLRCACLKSSGVFPFGIHARHFVQIVLVQPTD